MVFGCLRSKNISDIGHQRSPQRNIGKSWDDSVTPWTMLKPPWLGRAEKSHLDLEHCRNEVSLRKALAASEGMETPQRGWLSSTDSYLYTMIYFWKQILLWHGHLLGFVYIQLLAACTTYTVNCHIWVKLQEVRASDQIVHLPFMT